MRCHTSSILRDKMETLMKSYNEYYDTSKVITDKKEYVNTMLSQISKIKEQLDKELILLYIEENSQKYNIPEWAQLLLKNHLNSIPNFIKEIDACDDTYFDQITFKWNNSNTVYDILEKYVNRSIILYSVISNPIIMISYIYCLNEKNLSKFENAIISKKCIVDEFTNTLNKIYKENDIIIKSKQINSLRHYKNLYRLDIHNIWDTLKNILENDPRMIIIVITILEYYSNDKYIATYNTTI
jgi:hypothetical protein